MPVENRGTDGEPETQESIDNHQSQLIVDNLIGGDIEFLIPISSPTTSSPTKSSTATNFVPTSSATSSAAGKKRKRNETSQLLDTISSVGEAIPQAINKIKCIKCFF